MGIYSIKDLERLSRIKAHTIRIWEKRYALLEPDRTGTNIRTYSDEDLRKLLNVSLLNANGFKISKIASFNDAEIRGHVLALENSEDGAQDQVENLILAMTELDEERFEKVMSSNILRHGFESTMIQVIQPFLHRVGVLWQIEAVKPGQEHFISNLVRQKVIAAIDGLMPVEKTGKDTYLFFLPEGEMHELGLLFGNYLARKRGHRTIYLGQSVPFADLQAIIAHRRPTHLVTGFLSHQQSEEVNRYLRKLHHHFPTSKVIFFHNPMLRTVVAATDQQVVNDLGRFAALLD
ncbi:MAG: MerR family transcriptional regulator [Flavobacteriales bacterium]|nr:MerR family transcriptional regulator [Flavobacteriales bacterium]